MTASVPLQLAQQVVILAAVITKGSKIKSPFSLCLSNNT